MPANLPPPYYEAEKRYREARTPEEKLDALEEMLTIMPKHKGTDKLRADLRRRIAKCKAQSQQKKAHPSARVNIQSRGKGRARWFWLGLPMWANLHWLHRSPMLSRKSQISLILHGSQHLG